MVKNWKETKYKSKQHTMYVNTLPKYKQFEDNYYMTYGDNGEVAWLSVIKQGKQIVNHKFADFPSAESWAKRYMNSHRG